MEIPQSTLLETQEDDQGNLCPDQTKVEKSLYVLCIFIIKQVVTKISPFMYLRWHQNEHSNISVQK